ncbi:hypothetical protein J2Z42_000158 [Clostridium algifaecis]|uniref:Copper amine oxidase-like N-terminal domain-containing protein n=1 Tax=Clostridium algifaecis TaxID=1472040 RepID=A0ABS4KN78_9CLOT|nr:DUF2334 domain-containing protein [Clostridium algifaecis]MBP2031493.1 hypothetical protein [Clostridium algifaecis]
MNKHKFIIFSIAVVLILCLIILRKNILTVRGNSNSSNNNQFSLSQLNMQKLDINLSYENKKIKFNLPIGMKNNIYYIPLNDVISNFGGTLTRTNNKLNLTFNSINSFIDIKGNTYMENNKTYNLRHKIFLEKNIIYISMFDFTNIFNLKTYWNEKNSEIDFYKNRENILIDSSLDEKKAALIRLEDVTAGGAYNSHDTLEKLRIITDYLYNKHAVFHVAWVPRYVDPSKNIDNNLLKNYNMFNADFLFTLDYMISRNGIIGLHGYTHQYKNTKSIDSIEFHMGRKDTIPEDTEYAEDRINKALETAHEFNINCNFFEAPHYAILPPQMKAIEKFFNYMYEPYSENGGLTECKNIIKFNESNRKAVYVPTPLGYVDGANDCKNMLNKIKKMDNNSTASLFYHPPIEFQYINLNRNKNGYPTYTYSINSPLHQIVDEFEKRNYKFCSIDTFVNKYK